MVTTLSFDEKLKNLVERIPPSPETVETVRATGSDEALRRFDEGYRLALYDWYTSNVMALNDPPTNPFQLGENEARRAALETVQREYGEGFARDYARRFTDTKRRTS